MPSWSASSPPEKADRTQATATAVARARRLLEQLFAGRRDAEQPPRPKS